MSSAPRAAVIRRRRLFEATVTAYRQPTPVNDMLTLSGQHTVDHLSRNGVIGMAKKSKKNKKNKKAKKAKKSKKGKK
jgi:hypothetical protein